MQLDILITCLVNTLAFKINTHAFQKRKDQLLKMIFTTILFFKTANFFPLNNLFETNKNGNSLLPKTIAAGHCMFIKLFTANYLT